MNMVSLKMILVGVVALTFIVTGILVLWGVAEKIYTPVYIDEMNAYAEMRFYYEIIVNLILGISGVMSLVFGFAVLFSLGSDFAKLMKIRSRIYYYKLRSAIENESVESIVKVGQGNIDKLTIV